MGEATGPAPYFRGLDPLFDHLGIVLGQFAGAQIDAVLEAGAEMPAVREGIHQHAYVGLVVGRAGHRDRPFAVRRHPIDQQRHNSEINRHRAGKSEHELDVVRRFKQTFGGDGRDDIEVTGAENLDLSLHPILRQPACYLADMARTIVVKPVGQIERACLQRHHFDANVGDGKALRMAGPSTVVAATRIEDHVAAARAHDFGYSLICLRGRSWSRRPRAGRDSGRWLRRRANSRSRPPRSRPG